MKKQIFTLLLAVTGLNLHAQTYCSAANSSSQVNYYVKQLSTTGANENISVVNGVYPSAGTGYKYDQTQTLKMSPGQTLTLNVTSNLPPSGQLWSMFGCWIDFNGDGDFDDSGERVLLLGDYGPSANNVGVVLNIAQQIQIPSDVTLGNTRMRLRYRESWTNNVTTPTIPVCGNVAGGTTYDFDVQFETLTTINNVVNAQSDNFKLKSTVVDKNIEIISSNLDVNPNDVNVKIYNMAGNLLKSVNGNEMNVSELAPSMYIVHVNYSGKDTVHKVLVVR